MSQDYNATIHLPKTDFPMRAGLPKREPEMLRNWKKLDVYGELLKKNAGGSPSTTAPPSPTATSTWATP